MRSGITVGWKKRDENVSAGGDLKVRSLPTCILTVPPRTKSHLLSLVMIFAITRLRLVDSEHQLAILVNFRPSLTVALQVELEGMRYWQICMIDVFLCVVVLLFFLI